MSPEESASPQGGRAFHPLFPLKWAKTDLHADPPLVKPAPSLLGHSAFAVWRERDYPRCACASPRCSKAQVPLLPAFAALKLGAAAPRSSAGHAARASDLSTARVVVLYEHDGSYPSTSSGPSVEGRRNRNAPCGATFLEYHLQQGSSNLRDAGGIAVDRQHWLSGML